MTGSQQAAECATRVAAALQAVSEAEGSGLLSTDQVKFFRGNLNELTSFFAVADPVLVQTETWTELSSALTGLEADLRGLGRPEEPNRLQGAIAGVDRVNELTHRWPPLAMTSRSEALKNLGGAALTRSHELDSQLSAIEQRVVAVQDTVGVTEVSVDTQISGAKSEIEQTFASAKAQSDQSLKTLEAQITQEKTRMDTAISEWQTNSTASLDKSVADAKAQSDQSLQELRGQIAQEKTRLDTAISEWQANSAAALEKNRTDFQTLLDQNTVLLNNLVKDQHQEAGKSIAHLHDLEKQAAEVVHATSSIATAGGYGGQADFELKVADKWRDTAVYVAVAAILVTVGAYLAGVFVNSYFLSLPGSIRTFVLVGTLGGLAAYCAAQSGLHRKRETRYREIQLQLAAMRPFVANLPEPKQEELLSTFAGNIFKGVVPAKEEPATSEHDMNLAGKVAGAIVANLPKTPN